MDEARALAGKLRDCGNDPMWADHAEVPKSWCLAAADLLDRRAAPEGVGLTRYDLWISTDDTIEKEESSAGEWVRHEDAAAIVSYERAATDMVARAAHGTAAALAAEKARATRLLEDALRWKHTCLAAGERADKADKRGDDAEAQRDTLKTALEAAEAALFWAARQHHEYGNKRAQRATELSAHAARTALASIQTPGEDR